MFGSAAMATTFHVNTSVLWKVSLGFIPSLVNLHKRLADSAPDDCQEDAKTKISNTSMLHSIYVVDGDVPDVESLSDISGNSSSFMSEASPGWPAPDPRLEMFPSIETSVKDDDSDVVSWFTATSTNSTVVTYSGSYFNFARKPEDNVPTRVEPDESAIEQQYGTSSVVMGKFRHRIIPNSECSI
jgi:hypothetical protein